METYKTLKASTSSITFPAADTGKQPIVYVHTEDRECSNEIRATVNPVLATPGNVSLLQTKQMEVLL